MRERKGAGKGVNVELKDSWRSYGICSSLRVSLLSLYALFPGLIRENERRGGSERESLGKSEEKAKREREVHEERGDERRRGEGKRDQRESHAESYERPSLTLFLAFISCVSSAFFALTILSSLLAFPCSALLSRS